MNRDYSVPLAGKVGVGVLAGVGVVLGNLMGRPDTSLSFGVCFGLVGLAAFVRRDLRDRPTYWLSIGAWLALFMAIDFSVGSLSFPALKLLLPIIAIGFYIPILGTFFLIDKLKR
jgi:hypothetical protein